VLPCVKNGVSNWWRCGVEGAEGFWEQLLAIRVSSVGREKMWEIPAV